MDERSVITVDEFVQDGLPEFKTGIHRIDSNPSNGTAWCANPTKSLFVLSSRVAAAVTAVNQSVKTNPIGANRMSD